MVGHCKDTLELGTAGTLCSWALQGYFAVGHCEDTLRLGTARILVVIVQRLCLQEINQVVLHYDQSCQHV